MLDRKVERPAPDWSDVNGRKSAQAGVILPGNSCLDSAEQTAQQRDQGGANQGDTATGHQLLHALAFGTGVIVAISFQQVDDTPNAKTGTQSDNEG